MQRKTTILIAVAATCLAITCLFPPWSYVGGHISAADYGFLLADHHGQRIDFARLLVGWMGIVSIGIVLAVCGEPISAGFLVAWKRLISVITAAVFGTGRAIRHFLRTFFSWRI